MCGRFNNQITSYGEWVDLLRELPEYVASYNVAPSTTIPVATSAAGRLMRWGLVPTWSKSFTTKFATFNARIETVAETPSFREAWNNKQRCIIPMAGYYEWSVKNGRKHPYYIHSDKKTSPENKVICAAGIYERWGNQSDYSCTMLTQPATDELKDIHHRMPVLLSPTQASHWLDGSVNIFNGTPSASSNLSSHAVSPLIGNTSQDSEALIEPHLPRDLFD